MKTAQELCVAMFNDIDAITTDIDAITTDIDAITTYIDAITTAGRHLTTSLYDHKFCGDLNKLRMTLAAKKNRSLAKAPSL